MQLIGVVSAEGSSGVVYEGRLDGQVVAVKTFSAPSHGSSNWAEYLAYFRNEVASYRAMESALPKGWVPKMRGEVEVGGNPSFATELIVGKDPDNLTVAQARRISPVALRQAAQAREHLARRGYGGSDSPQSMILTRDQLVNGVPRKAGEAVFMDAGELTSNSTMWQKSAELVTKLAYAREIAKNALPGQESLTIKELNGTLGRETRDLVRAAARAVSEVVAAEEAPTTGSRVVAAPKVELTFPNLERTRPSRPSNPDAKPRGVPTVISPKEKKAAAINSLRGQQEAAEKRASSGIK